MNLASQSNHEISLLGAQQLFKSAIAANLTIIAGVIILSSFFYNDAGETFIIWSGLMCMNATVRILIAKNYLIDEINNFKKYELNTWIKTYIYSSLITGLGWGSLVFFVPETSDLINISATYIIFFAAMAGTITSLPVVLPAFYAYTTPIFLSSFAFSFFISSKINIYIGVASVIYFAFIISAGRVLNKHFTKNFALHTKNDELIDKLHNENIQKELAQQELLNNQQTLEETVEQRTQELASINEALVTEINERRRIESNLKHVAHHDALTNLPNRLLLDARLNHAIERANRNNLQVAVMFIDLDRFKNINDSLGHDIGDKLLIAISNRLLHCVREDDTVARLGGDEFIIIIEQVHDIGDLDSLLKKIMKVTSEPVTINQHELTTSASIGISIYPDDGTNNEQLMRNADAAMYYVKENGRHRYHFYTRQLTATAYDRVILETDLKHAIKNNQIQIYYQPQISLQTKNIIGVEALVRWQHPELDLLPPKQFLYIAEQSGLINKIGETVLTGACRQIVKWKQQGLPIEKVAVNIAGNQIHHGDLVAIVKQALQQTKCKTDWLELEITEDFIINKTKQAITTLQQLRDLGISLAIDDFGTGYSSLSYLKQLPVNKLKIDRSFVSDINEDPEDATLVQAIIAMGKSLQLKLIAEGVENKQHEIFLSENGCDYAQGFYYSKPVPADKIEKIFNKSDDKLRRNIKLVSNKKP